MLTYVTCPRCRQRARMLKSNVMADHKTANYAIPQDPGGRVKEHCPYSGTTLQEAADGITLLSRLSGGPSPAREPVGVLEPNDAIEASETEPTWREAFEHEPTRLLEYTVRDAPRQNDRFGKEFDPRWVRITCRWRRGEWVPISVLVADAPYGLMIDFPVVAGRPDWVSRLLDEAMAGIRRTAIVDAPAAPRESTSLRPSSSGTAATTGRGPAR